MLRHNVVGIQMLRRSLRDHIFKNKVMDKPLSEKLKNQIIDHLRTFNIPYDKVQNMDSVELNLPLLRGNSIAEHFKNIANKQTNSYVDLANRIANASLPSKPKTWILREGWTRYDATTGTWSSVEFPTDEVLVIDVEALVPSGGHPLMVTAVSPHCWYSWCSRYLLPNQTISGTPNLSDLVKVSDISQHQTESLLIGHNISFDRSFMREQYLIEPSKTNFLDTMALHIAICGLTSCQRLLHVAAQKNKENGKPMDKTTLAMQKWMSKGCLNNLSDVYQFHCKKKPLNKQLRDFFVEGSIDDIKDNFQDLMTYCADDVLATYNVFKVLWPKFKQRFPHPVTLGGMFEMGKAYLPVNENWFKYIERSNKKYEELEQKGLALLTSLAEDARLKMNDESYKQDIWLWDLDWTKKSKRLKKIEAPSKTKTKPKRMTDAAPKWYAELCEVDENNNMAPSKISLQRRIAVKLLQLVWNGFPLHHSNIHGWGFLVPFSSDAPFKSSDYRTSENGAEFPLKQFVEYCNNIQPNVLRKIQVSKRSDSMLVKEVLDEIDTFWEAHDNNLNELVGQPKIKSSSMTAEEMPILNVVPGCYFYRLPHKDGEGKNVGNPLSKGFHHDIDQGTLGSLLGKSVDAILKQGSISSYWKNNVNRISSQFVIGLDRAVFPDNITGDENYDPGKFYGAILPRIVTAGTVTRRAVEPTWLTASNAYSNRIGSELKSMVQSPPGYSFVGADVDSQELWIAALLGDAHFAGEHGCTAFGWMTLQGTKAEGTDMHSRVAEMLGISREHAKVFNYGRIYGAGLKFAEQMLHKFNAQIPKEEAKERATRMFQATKGKKARGKYSEDGTYMAPEWTGGSESYMFNMLEKIASSSHPKTPVLKASMSQAIEPAVVGKDFMTSRVNWVVQSSAVDYLHLMLVCMRWLFEEYNIEGRFCISIHDEVRYLVPDKDKYRAALALQITNLFTRSMFVHELQFDDLPQSVAFFSSVEIDKCLRKDSLNDCITPSNEGGLQEKYNIPKGESLTISDILEKTNGKLEDDRASNELDMELGKNVAL